MPICTGEVRLSLSKAFVIIEIRCEVGRVESTGKEGNEA